MEVVNTKIQDAQTEYDNEVERLTNEFKDARKKLKERHESDKTGLIDRLVHGIVTKIL